MRILFVNKLYPPDIGGGAELILASLAAGHRARGHDVTVATTTAGDVEVEEEVDGVRVVRMPLRNLYWHHADKRAGTAKRLLWHARDIHNVSMGQALLRVIQRYDPELVCFHNLAGFSASAWGAAARAGKPQVQVLHDYYHLCPRSQLFHAGRTCERLCVSCRPFRIGRSSASNGLTAVIGVSHSVLDAHLENGLFAEVGIRTVIHNARPFSQGGTRDYPETAASFGFMGTLGDWKGIRQLLQAFVRVSSEPGMPRLRLVVAGTGEASYVQELHQLFAAEHITFVGSVDPESFYRQIDVSIVPSLWRDPLPTVTAESLLFGVPVIGARRGGIPEMVIDGVNGLLYEPDESQALEGCLRRMALSPGLLREYGERARMSASHFADMDRMLDQHYAVFQAAVTQCA